jgi:hypothetical protein
MGISSSSSRKGKLQFTSVKPEYERSEKLKLIVHNMQGNREESTKRLRDAILLAEKLRWRCEAYSYLSAESRVNAERAWICADVVAECLHRLLSPHDKAETILLEAAVAAAEPRVLQFYLDAEVQLPSSLVDEVEGLLGNAWKETTWLLQEKARNIKELETLESQRDEYRLSQLIDVYDEYIAACRAATLNSGDLPAEAWATERRDELRFMRDKLSVTKPVVQQLNNIARKVAELQDSSDKLDGLELRCWAGVASDLNSTLGPVLSFRYGANSTYHTFRVLKCVGAQLRIMVVESLIGAARQHQLEVRAEWRPGVIRLLLEAAHWAHICAEKTLGSIEAMPRTKSWEQPSARVKWPTCYHEASDRCAMLYARAAAELRASCNRACSHHAHCQLRATVYRIASDASVREADVIVHQDLSAEESRQQQSSASEINKLSVCLAEGLPAQCDPGAVETFGVFARRVLEDPAVAEVNLLAVRQAHDALMTGTPIA